MLNGFELMNQYGEKKIPFFFLLSYDKSNLEVHRLDQPLPKGISFRIDKTEYNPIKKKNKPPVKISLSKAGLYEEYKKGYAGILKEIYLGNSFLCNYSLAIPVSCNTSMSSLYAQSVANFKLKYKNRFVCFSPEAFVNIKGTSISTFPMKGTAMYKSYKSLDNLLADPKEKAEHYTVVDLLRNDLSIVSNMVEVKKLRYPTFIKSKGKQIVQLSSEIEGTLKRKFEWRFGDVFNNLTPAGSISGAPKSKTLELIKAYETYQRGFYTGVFGFFDGEILKSAVAIRFLEQTEQGLVYKTGGGLTSQSDIKKEFQEIIDKIYVPTS